MARGERNARHDDRAPMIDPWFGRGSYAMDSGFSRSSSIDPTGYAVEDAELAGRLRQDPIGPDVSAPLGGPMLGRLAISSYGGEYGSVPGGALDRLEEYPGAAALGMNAAAGMTGGPAEAGAASTRSRLGIPPEGGLFLGEQHAMGRAPLPMDGTVGEHVISGLRRFVGSGIYDGGDQSGYGAYAGGMGGDYGPGSAEERLGVLPRHPNAGFEDEGGDGWPGGFRRRPSSVDELDT